jgi:hypothetical protein
MPEIDYARYGLRGLLPPARDARCDASRDARCDASRERTPARAKVQPSQTRGLSTSRRGRAPQPAR